MSFHRRWKIFLPPHKRKHCINISRWPKTEGRGTKDTKDRESRNKAPELKQWQEEKRESPCKGQKKEGWNETEPLASRIRIPEGRILGGGCPPRTLLHQSTAVLKWTGLWNQPRKWLTCRQFLWNEETVDQGWFQQHKTCQKDSQDTAWV